jgi:hypothetical protein
MPQRKIGENKIDLSFNFLPDGSGFRIFGNKITQFVSSGREFQDK